MLDSVTEKDRGYNYQDVIGDLAELADLILVLFDPHKAGTIRESYASLRETLPTKTFENRLIFVLNRIDECSHLEDLLRVFGTLCWNLSQMTGRKDIPQVMLTYARGTTPAPKQELFLSLLDNQRTQLKQAIFGTPQARLDNLVSFIDYHSNRLETMMDVFFEFYRRKRAYKLKVNLIGILLSSAVGAITIYFTKQYIPDEKMKDYLVTIPILSGIAFLFSWLLTITPICTKWFHRRQLRRLENMIILKTQHDQDTWLSVKELAISHLTKVPNPISFRDLKKHRKAIWNLSAKGVKEMRIAVNKVKQVGNPKIKKK